MERETLKSRLGFILLSAGCAIGIGNVWKFPYIAGQGGGGAFVLFYLIFLVILGLPIMTMEFAVGRASRKSPVRAYQALEKPGQKWHIHGYFTLIGCYLLMMFYTTVAGWMLAFMAFSGAGTFEGLIGAHRTLVAGTAHGELHGHDGQTQNDEEQQVEQHESAAAALTCHVRELPHISDADRAAGGKEDEPESRFEFFAFH